MDQYISNTCLTYLNAHTFVVAGSELFPQNALNSIGPIHDQYHFLEAASVCWIENHRNSDSDILCPSRSLARNLFEYPVNPQFKLWQLVFSKYLFQPMDEFEVSILVQPAHESSKDLRWKWGPLAWATALELLDLFDWLAGKQEMLIIGMGAEERQSELHALLSLAIMNLDYIAFDASLSARYEFKRMSSCDVALRMCMVSMLLAMGADADWMPRDIELPRALHAALGEAEDKPIAMLLLGAGARFRKEDILALDSWYHGMNLSCWRWICKQPLSSFEISSHGVLLWLCVLACQPLEIEQLDLISKIQFPVGHVDIADWMFGNSPFVALALIRRGSSGWELLDIYSSIQPLCQRLPILQRVLQGLRVLIVHCALNAAMGRSRTFLVCFETNKPFLASIVLHSELHNTLINRVLTYQYPGAEEYHLKANGYESSFYNSDQCDDTDPGSLEFHASHSDYSGFDYPQGMDFRFDTVEKLIQLGESPDNATPHIVLRFTMLFR